MNLPHMRPLLFAGNIVDKNINTATVLCEFEDTPTLPMLMEAAAQSSAAFSSADNVTAGFFISCKNIRLLTPTSGKHFHIKVTIEAEVDNIKKIFFEAFDISEKTKYATGSITLLTEQ